MFLSRAKKIFTQLAQFGMVWFHGGLVVFCCFLSFLIGCFVVLRGALYWIFLRASFVLSQ